MPSSVSPKPRDPLLELYPRERRPPPPTPTAYELDGIAGTMSSNPRRTFYKGETIIQRGPWLDMCFSAI